MTHPLIMTPPYRILGNLCVAKFLRILRILANRKSFFREISQCGCSPWCTRQFAIFFLRNLRELSFHKKFSTHKFPDIRYSIKIFLVKTFTNSPETAKFMKVFTREKFPLYGTLTRNCFSPETNCTPTLSKPTC